MTENCGESPVDVVVKDVHSVLQFENEEGVWSSTRQSVSEVVDYVGLKCGSSSVILTLLQKLQGVTQTDDSELNIIYLLEKKPSTGFVHVKHHHASCSSD